MELYNGEEYKGRYNTDLKEDLPSLFYPIRDYKTVRARFWSMVTDLFSETFAKQVFDWFHERNLKFTGHLTLEETFISQLLCNGACMPGHNIGDS